MRDVKYHKTDAIPSEPPSSTMPSSKIRLFGWFCWRIWGLGNPFQS